MSKKAKRHLILIIILAMCILTIAQAAPYTENPNIKELMAYGVSPEKLQRLSDLEIDSLLKEALANHFTSDQVHQYVEGLLTMPTEQSENISYEYENGCFITPHGPIPDLLAHIVHSSEEELAPYDSTVSVLSIEYPLPHASHVTLGDNSVIWISEGVVYIWNGDVISNFALPLQGKTIVDIAWHDGSLFYLDDTGGIHKVWYDNYDYFSSLSEIFHVDQFTLEQSSLISCGGKLWLSAAIIYSSGDKSQLDRIAYSGLVDVYANTVVALEGQADTIKYATANEDGSINFLMTRVFPIMPNPLPIEAKENSYWITINSADEITIEPAADKGLVNRERQYFLAQDGTLWRFDAKPGITAVKPDGTEVSFVPAGSLPQNDITLLFNGTKVGFDASLYIEKGCPAG
ncbi:MAG: hypothetical protein NC238_15525 [Dehalobacter sp.]|nr:hypothetical protein [Dehalobacter sp.]